MGPEKAGVGGPLPRARLSELALLFLRLGFTAFGGPAAHIAIMENEVVRRRRWLSPERFLDLLGASNLIPGPSSTELAIFIGYEQAGWPGLLVGGTCFILPAALMVGVLGWAYVRFGALPQVAGVLYGIKPVVIAVVLQALLGSLRRPSRSLRGSASSASRRAPPSPSASTRSSCCSAAAPPRSRPVD